MSAAFAREPDVEVTIFESQRRHLYASADRLRHIEAGLRAVHEAQCGCNSPGVAEICAAEPRLAFRCLFSGPRLERRHGQFCQARSQEWYGPCEELPDCETVEAFTARQQRR